MSGKTNLRSLERTWLIELCNWLEYVDPKWAQAIQVTAREITEVYGNKEGREWLGFKLDNLVADTGTRVIDIFTMKDVAAVLHLVIELSKLDKNKYPEKEKVLRLITAATLSWQSPEFYAVTFGYVFNKRAKLEGKMDNSINTFNEEMHIDFTRATEDGDLFDLKVVARSGKHEQQINLRDLKNIIVNIEKKKLQ